MSLLYEIFILPIEIIYRAIYLGSLQFTHNYGLSILVLSCISAVAFIPLGRLAVGTQAREKKLQMIMAPQLARIRKESKGAERQRRINNLYKRYAYHPLLAVRSAFGVALQIPFLTGAYYMILGLTQLQGQPCLMIPDLSQPDGLLWGVNALPIVMTVVNIIATLTTPGLTRKDTLQAIIIAFFFLALLYNAASALLIFWTMNNVFFLLQNLRLPIRLPRFRKPGFAQGGMNTVMAATMRSVYSLSCAGLAILIFLYVPFQSYASDPNFFAAGPLDVLLGMVRYLSLTFFVVFVLWLWFPAKAKTIPAFVAFWALSLAFVNLFVLPGHFGALDGIRFLREAALTGPMSTFKDGLLPVLVALGLTALLFAFPKVRLQLPRVLSIAVFSLRKRHRHSHGHVHRRPYRTDAGRPLVHQRLPQGHGRLRLVPRHHLHGRRHGHEPAQHLRRPRLQPGGRQRPPRRDPGREHQQRLCRDAPQLRGPRLRRLHAQRPGVLQPGLL